MAENNQTGRVCILVPVYNEAGSIRLLVEKVLRAFSDNAIAGEIVFVNDGSTDGSQQVIEACCREHDFIRVITHPERRGLTEVLKTAIKHASGEIVITLPADLESDPEEDIPKLLNEMSKGFDAVAGWRQGRRDGKVLASRIYNSVCRMLFNLHLHDMNWIKAVKREALEDLNVRSDWHRFLLPILAARGYRIGEVKTNWYPRKSGRSKSGIGRGFTFVLDLLVLKFLLTFARGKAPKTATGKRRS